MGILSWWNKRRSIKNGSKAMDEIIDYLENIIRLEMSENQKIYNLLESLKTATTLESKIQIYINLKQEIAKERNFESKTQALESNLKSILGDHLKEMHSQI